MVVLRSIRGCQPNTELLGGDVDSRMSNRVSPGQVSRHHQRLPDDRGVAEAREGIRRLQHTVQRALGARAKQREQIVRPRARLAQRRDPARLLDAPLRIADVQQRLPAAARDGGGNLLGPRATVLIPQ